MGRKHQPGDEYHIQRALGPFTRSGPERCSNIQSDTRPTKHSGRAGDEREGTAAPSSPHLQKGGGLEKHNPSNLLQSTKVLSENTEKGQGLAAG